MIEITDLDHNGKGIGRLDDKIVFIKNALPGEIVEINTIKNQKKYIEAEVKKYIKTSEKRIDSICPYYNECGGCDLLHLSYDDQLEFKQNKINNIINKYLKEKITINNIIKSNDNYYYRNKITFQVNKNIGFFNDKSNNIIKIDKCIISHELINNSIKYLNNLDLTKINKITMRVGNDKLMIIIDTIDKNLDIKPLKDVAQSIYIKYNNDYILKYGYEYIYENIGEYRFMISPDSFFQINKDVCEKLYNKIKDYTKNSKNILDLYCGTGTIGIFVGENNNVIGIEVNEYAIKNALNNKVINNKNNIDFICGDSGKKLRNINFKPDTVIIDPPRSGLNKETINNILKLNPEKIIYVSCDPMTLVRDLNILKDFYNIIELTPFDMFPNTKHVESIVYLSKKKTIHNMKLNPEPFSLIKSGDKTIELRLYDEKRKKIKVGDLIIFTNTLTKESTTKRVIKLHKFTNFNELYKSLPLLKCGYTNNTINKATPIDMMKYYSLEEQLKYGVVGIELSDSK